MRAAFVFLLSLALASSLDPTLDKLSKRHAEPPEDPETPPAPPTAPSPVPSLADALQDGLLPYTEREIALYTARDGDGKPKDPDDSKKEKSKWDRRR